MKYSVIFHPEAEEEYNEAIWWYAKQQKGLDIEFVRCIDESIQKIKRNPELYPFEFENYRKKVVKRFPFKVIYEILKDSIFVLAIFHFKRDSSLLHSRI